MQVAHPTTFHADPSCRHAQAKANISCFQPITIRHINLLSSLLLPLHARIPTPHRLQTSHPCESYGMAVVSYSVLARPPCATAKKPASRCHASLLRTTDDFKCDFSCSSYYCTTRNYAIGVARGEVLRYRHCKAVSINSLRSAARTRG